MQWVTTVIFSFLSAFLLNVATPGYDLYFSAFVAFVPVMYVIRKMNKTFFPSFLFGLFFYIFSLKWIITTVTDFGNAPKIVGILILIIFSLYLSLYFYLFFICFKKKLNTILLASIFVILEMMRGVLFSGFPWLNLGLTQYNNFLFKNIYPVIGEYGVSFVIILINLSLFYLFFERRYFPISFAIIFTTFLVLLGNYFVKDFKKEKSINVAIIQPSYSQKDKWNPMKKDEIINDVLNMLKKINKEKLNLIVMPESVFPTFCNDEQELINYLNELVDNKPLIFGCLRYEGDEKTRYYNSVFFLNNGVLSTYDKIHLVPFGEYFPLKNLLKLVEYYFFKNAEDFSPGKKITVFNRNNIKYATPLCYETAYSLLVRKFLKKGGNVFVFLSNDSWFGYSTGRIQHLAIDIIRSYEFYRPVIRGTQSGISACINPENDNIKLLPSGKKGVLKCEVPLIKGETLFSKITYWWVLLFVFLGIVLEIKNKKRKTY